MAEIEVYPSPEDQQAIIEGQFPTVAKAKKGKRSGTSAREWQVQIGVCERSNQSTYGQARRNLTKFRSAPLGKRIQVPLLTPLILIKSALSTFRNPYISVRPRKKASATTPQEILGAAVQETYINWLWKEQNMRKVVRQVVTDSLLLTGRGITAPGYSALFDGQSTISYDTVTAYRVSPFDYMLDMEADSSDNAFYGIKRLIMPIPLAAQMFNKPEDIFLPLKYTRWAKVKPMEKDINRNHIRRFGRTIVYEVQDLLAGKFHYLTSGYDKFLESFNNPYPVDGLLPSFLEPIPIPDDIQCIPEASLIWPQLEELTDVRNFWLEHWRKLMPKYIYEKGSITQDELEKLTSAVGTTFAEMVTSIGGIKLLDTPGGQMDIQFHEAMVKEDIRDTTGINEYLRGSSVPRVKTAYETSQIQSGANVRIGDMNDLVELHCSDIAQKQLAIAAEFLSPEELFLIAGLPADLRTIGLPPGMIPSATVMKMETTVTVHTGSMTFPNKGQDPQKAALLMQLLGLPEINRYPVVAEILQLLDFNAQQYMNPPQAINPDEQKAAQWAVLTGGRGREAGGQETGQIFGSRQRPELMTPGAG
jgi:hypothetical protein